jgi:proteasome lid subunit RPN8/RPN11
VYEARQGLIKCLAPAKPSGKEPSVYVEEVDWGRFPPLDELAWLFYNFFNRYTDREVVMLVGEKLDGTGSMYYVPKQVGTSGSVKWTAGDKEMDQFQEQAQWVGTIHSHPGNFCTPSQTDIDDWAAPEKSGLHVVFGRDASFTINGAVAGRTFELYAGRTCKEECQEEPVEYQTSRGRSLEELLKKPAPVKTRTVSRGAVRVVGKRKRKWAYPHEKGQSGPLWDPETGLPLWHDDGDVPDYVEETLDVVGALSLSGVDSDGIPVLRIVEYNGKLYALTLAQYAELTEWCRGVCPLPKARRLRLHEAGGGR